MKKDHQAKLEKWGLDPLEAQVYLALVRNAQSAGASAIAAAIGMPRPSVYPILKTLVEKGMVQNGEGYGSQFAALPPDEALPRLIAAEKENLQERELLTTDLIKTLRSAAEEKPGASATELVEVIRDPRVSSNRLQKLQEEARTEIDALVRAPLILKNMVRNPGEAQSLRRGVRHRAIYESAILEHRDVAPYLIGWIQSGEEAREYKGDLPFKLALFDAQIAWVPLETNAKRHPVVSVLIRHPALGKALRLLFDYLWNESTPIALGRKHARKQTSKHVSAPRNRFTVERCSHAPVAR
jgi:HTH-type transcriptional regulator, sugar sensing transcriptional regulator